MSNLHENISQFAEIISDIKEAIMEQNKDVTNCTPPSAYGDAIRAIQPQIGGGSCKCDLSEYEKKVDVDRKDNAILGQARDYADSLFKNDPSSSVTVGYVDEHDRATLADAKRYTDEKVAGVVEDAKDAAIDAAKDLVDGKGGGATYAYVDEHDRMTLETALSNDEDILEEAKEYTDSKMPEIIDGVDPSSTALVQSNAIARALEAKQDLLTSNSKLFTLQQGEKTAVDVHYNDFITIDAGGNATIVQGNVYLVLINDTKHIGVGDNGVYEGNPYTFRTDIQLKYGADNMIINNVEFTSTNPSITGTVAANKSYITWTIPDGADLNKTVDINVTVTGTHAAFGSNPQTAKGVVQIVGIKSAEDGVSYDIDLNYGYILGRLKDDGKSYSYIPNASSSYLKAQVFETSGSSRTLVGGSAYGYTLKYCFDGDTETIANTFDNGTKIYTLPVSEPTENNKFFHVYLYKDNVMWDHETLAIVRDGQKGDDAVSSTELVLVNDTKYIGTGADYKYDGAPIKFTTDATIQFGGEKLDFSKFDITTTGGITYVIKNIDAKNRQIEWTIPNETNLKDSLIMKISAAGMTNGITKAADGVVQIVGVKGGKDGESYDIETDYNFIIGSPTTDEGTLYAYTPEQIACTIKHAVGNQRNLAMDTDLTIKYRLDNNTSLPINVVNGHATIPVDDNKIMMSSRSLTLELYKGTILWDVEVLGIVRDGAKGRPGDAGTGIKIMADVTIAAESIAAYASDLGAATYNPTTGYTYPLTAYVPNNGDYLVALYNQNDTPTNKFEKAAVYKRTNNSWVAFPGTSTLEIGSTVAAPGTGHLIMWTGSEWVDIGTVTGGYIHQKFANEAMSATELANATTITYLPGNPKLIFTVDNTGSFTDGEIPGKYIGILIDDNSISSNAVGDYKWTRWAGEDGYGMEQIFFRGTSDKKPDTPTYTKRSDSTVSETTWYSYDYEPKVNDSKYGNGIQWLDHPVQPTIDSNCCWMSYRLTGIDAKRNWSEPMQYLLFAEAGKDVTTVHIQNDNITLLIDKDTNKTICNDEEACKIDLFIEGNKIDSGITNIHMNPAPTGMSISNIKPNGEFKITTAKDTNVSTIDHIQIDCEYNSNTYTGYVSVTKLMSGRCYDISCSPSVLRQDGNDNSLDNLVEKEGRKGVAFVITKELANGGNVNITNAATHPDYKITYKLKGDAEVEFTGSTDFIEIANVLKPIEYISIYSKEDSGWVFNDKQDIFVVKDGADGMDSEMQEFVYLVQGSESPAPNLFYKQGDVTSKTYIEANESQYTYSGKAYQDFDWLPFTGDKNPVSHWNDRALGVGPGETEWYAMRYKAAGKSGETKWGSFTAPKIWSRYGDDGRDGDGVEYIFCVTAGDTAPGINQTLGRKKGTTADNTNPKETTEWLPKIANTTAVLPADGYWSDDPLNVTKAYPVQWVSKRKYGYKTGSTTVKEWSEFSAPTKWSVYADTNTVAQLDNDKLFIGTGDDNILNSELDDINIKATLTNGGKACSALKINDVKQNGNSITKSGSTYKDGVVSFICNAVTADKTEFDIVLKKSVGNLDLTTPRIYTFDIEGKLDGQTYRGTAALTITALRNAKDGEFYSVVVTPNDVYVNAAGEYSNNIVNVQVIKTVGITHTSETWEDGQLYYYTDLDDTQINVPANGKIDVTTLDGQPNVLTVVFTKDGFYDSESAFINRERKSIKSMDEIYTIAPIGKMFDKDSEPDPSLWGTTIAEAISACSDVSNLTELDDKGYNLWNAMQITYTDDTKDYVDFTNLGNGIRNVVELYQVTNPNVIVTEDNINSPGIKPIVSVSADDADEALDLMLENDPEWYKEKPDSYNKFDCLWNVELIVTEDNKYRFTSVALINQMVYGENAYSLVIENQYPQLTCDANGNVTKGDFQSTAILMNGEKQIKENVSFKISAYMFTADGKKFYCSGSDANNYIYTNKDKSLIVSLPKDNAFAAGSTSIQIIGPNGSYNSNAGGFKKLDISVSNGKALISAPIDYAPEIEDCYTYVMAEYPTNVTEANRNAFTNCIASHGVNKGSSGVPYNYCGDWTTETKYYCSDVRTDLVHVNDEDFYPAPDDTTPRYYICTQEHVSTSGKFTEDLQRGYWKQFDGEYRSIATDLMLADTGVFDKLVSNYIETKELISDKVLIRDENDPNKIQITVDDVTVGEDELTKSYLFMDTKQMRVEHGSDNTKKTETIEFKWEFDTNNATEIYIPEIKIYGYWHCSINSDDLGILRTPYYEYKFDNASSQPWKIIYGVNEGNNKPTFKVYSTENNSTPLTPTGYDGGNTRDKYQFYRTGKGQTRRIEITIPSQLITIERNNNPDFGQRIYIKLGFGVDLNTSNVRLIATNSYCDVTATANGAVTLNKQEKKTGVVIGKNGFSITNGTNSNEVTTAAVFINEEGDMASQGFVLSKEINKIVLVSDAGQVGTENGVLYLLIGS